MFSLKSLSLGLAVALCLPTAAEAASWKIDPNHSSVDFVARHLKFAKVRGNFKVWSGTVTIDEKDITKSTVELTFDVASVSTGNDQRDEHLRGTDFFDVKANPKATFKSTKVEKAGDRLNITGDLTLHGKTKSVVIQSDMPSPEFKDPGGNVHVAIQNGTTKLVRQDFGLVWNKAVEGVGVVSDDIDIVIELELFGKK